MAAKARDAAHHGGAATDRSLPMIQMDYFFLGKRDKEELATGITVVDTVSLAIGACGLPKKTGNFVIEFLEKRGALFAVQDNRFFLQNL